MTLVIDSSAIVGLALSDEDTTYAEAVLTELAHDTVIAPNLFWFEVRNVMIVAERRKRISRGDVDSFLTEFNRLAIALDDKPNEQNIMALARSHSLSVYDAAYLELAMRTSSKIATLDKRLLSAANAESVIVFSPS